MTGITLSAGGRLADLTRSVRARILAWVLLLAAVGMAGAAGTAYGLERQRIDVRIEQALAQEVSEFAEFRRSAVDPRDGGQFTSLERLFEVALRRNVADHHQTLAAYLPDRTLSPAGGAVALHDDPAFRALVTGSPGPSSGAYASADGPVRYSTVPMTLGPERGTFVVVYFTGPERAELTEVFQIYSAVAVAALAVIAVVGWLAAGRLLRPIRDVRQTAQQISESDLTRRIVAPGNDDVSSLARTFNAMLDRLEEAFATQRRFLDEAGHELRTPITIVRGHLELLNTADAEETAEVRDLLLDELDRMSRSVEDLIVLAKAERPDFLRPDLVDVGRLTDHVLDKARALGDRGWRVDRRTEAWVVADAQRLTQALVQLAENAVKFTRPQDRVVIGSSSDGEVVRLWVSDTGPGIAAADAGRIFERFQRGRGAGRADGSGLGLAIVRAIAEAHGGSVRLHPTPGGGATFELTIPQAAAPVPAAVPQREEVVL
ncbi:ATP-binding protein [Kribbella sp. CA-253562]|uniref:sensor histidine kinase n=1 Tax=Kribbella sp. CA-253562 TaxID=3239942 RepID=UPI003D91B422